MAPFLAPIRTLIVAACGLIGIAMQSAVTEALGREEPVAVVLSVASAVAVGFGLRRIVTSMIRAAEETIDGLRKENDRLRRELEEHKQ